MFTPTHTQPIPANTASQLLKVAWMAALLGITIQLVLLAIAMLGAKTPAAEPLVGQFAQKVSWSMIVCLSLAAGHAMSRAHPAVMAAAGLLGAPLAFTAARALQKIIDKSLDVVSAGDAVAPVLQATLKGLEYLCLGIALAWLGKKLWQGLRPYVGVGLAHGVLFGGALVWIASAAEPPIASLRLFAIGINELLFPVGCSLVLYFATRFGQAQVDQ